MSTVDEREAAPVALPSLTRVAVLVGDNHQIDAVIPSQVALQLVMEDLVPTLRDAVPGPFDVTLSPGAAWTLAKTGSAPIARSRSLDDEQIRDGDLLVLREVFTGERFSPIVEEVSDAVARFNDRRYPAFTSPVARIAGLIAVPAGAAALSVVLWLGWQVADSAIALAAFAGFLGIASWGCAVLARSRFRAPAAGYALYVASLPLLFITGVLAVPVADGAVPRAAGSSNVLLGWVMVLAASVVFAWTTASAVMVTTLAATLAVVGGMGAALLAYTSASGQLVAAGIVLVSVVVLAIAPKLTILLSRVRPPSLPAPGEPVSAGTLSETFQPGRTNDDETGNRHLEKRAFKANRYITGMTIAASVLLVGGAVLSIVPHTFHTIPSIVLASTAAMVAFLRARTFVDRVQATALYVTAFAIAVGGAGVVAHSYPSTAVQLITVVVVVAVVLGGACAGVFGPGADMSPVTKRLIEMIEWLLIASLVPMALWVTGIYGMLRGA